MFRLKKFPIVRQLDAMDCGPSCLKMISKSYGKEISREYLRERSHIGTSGVSLLGLSDAAQDIGFRTISGKLTFEQLVEESELPCILFWSSYHFVVLYRANKKYLWVADPAIGRVKYSKHEFLKHWIATEEDNEQKGIGLFLIPGSQFYKSDFEETNSNLDWSSLSRLVLNYKKELLQLVVGLLFGSLLQLILPFLTQSIVDVGVNTNNINFIQVILAAQFMLFFSRTIIDFIRNRILLFISTHINLVILSEFWFKLLKLPIQFFLTRHVGDLLQRLNDYQRIQDFVTGTALMTLFSFVNLIIFSVVLLTYDPTIFVIFMFGSALYLLWILIFLRKRRKLDYRMFDAGARENSITMQMIYGIQDIKLNEAESIKRWEWERAKTSVFKINFGMLNLNQVQQAGAFFINEGKNIFIIYLTAVSVLQGQLTLGAMLAIQYIIGQLTSPIDQIVNFTQELQDAKISVERLNEIHKLDDEEKIATKFGAITNFEIKNLISFKDFSFKYPGAGNPNLFNEINLTIPIGKTTAIVGNSGSGKTTLIKILLKFYTEYEGKLIADDLDFSRLSPKAWRKQCGSVLQDNFIFNDTITANISLGDEKPDMGRILHACKIANIQEFIEKLPLRFNTRIGNDGQGISAGQRQRILIARTIYKNPKFIFFDEATNALDTENEAKIIGNLSKELDGKTVVIVAHRLSTVMNADQIIVLDEGKVVEVGNHYTLVDAKGAYYNLIQNQLELSK